MTEKIHKTQLGDIHYWTNILNKDSVTLVFLTGLISQISPLTYYTFV